MFEGWSRPNDKERSALAASAKRQLKIDFKIDVESLDPNVSRAVNILVTCMVETIFALVRPDGRSLQISFRYYKKSFDSVGEVGLYDRGIVFVRTNLVRAFLEKAVHYFELSNLGNEALGRSVSDMLQALLEPIHTLAHELKHRDQWINDPKSFENDEPYYISELEIGAEEAAYNVINSINLIGIFQKNGIGLNAQLANNFINDYKDKLLDDINIRRYVRRGREA